MLSVEQLSLSLEEAKDELQVTKRKNNAAIKVCIYFNRQYAVLPAKEIAPFHANLLH